MTGRGEDRASGGWSVDRFFGKYEGVVTDVADPKKIGRLRAKVPAVLGEDLDTGWALPCVPYGGGEGYGMLLLPHVGDTVWVEFAGGDVSRPIWSGTFWGAPDSTGPEAPTGDGGKEGSPTLGVLKTKGGHELTLDDDGEVVLLANGNGKSSIRFEQDGTIVLTAEKIKLGASAREKVVLGDAFLQLFNTHTHPTGVGPSGPPVQPMVAPTHLSAKVTTE